MDDSDSLVFDETGWLEARLAGKQRALYFFGYGNDYAACLQDYFKVAGRVPSFFMQETGPPMGGGIMPAG